MRLFRKLNITIKIKYSLIKAEKVDNFYYLMINYDLY